jgi:hypothetical protein
MNVYSDFTIPASGVMSKYLSISGDLFPTGNMNINIEIKTTLEEDNNRQICVI